MQNLHPPIQSWFLFEQDNPGNVLYFQFNPSEMNVEYVSEWEEVDVANVSVQTTQFKQRKPKKFTFELWLNEWGEHVGPYNNSPYRFSVEEQINWLDSRMYPRKNRDGQKFSPPVLIFFWKEFEPVILTNMTVKRTHFRPLSASRVGGLNSPVGETELSDLERDDALFPGSGTSAFTATSESIFALPNLNTLENYGQNRTPSKPLLTRQPGDAIRASVSITLLEYRKSTANASGTGILDQIINFVGDGFTSLSDLISGSGSNPVNRGG